MNPIDKNRIDSEVGSLRVGYLCRFALDLVVAGLIATLLLNESFGNQNKIACLIAIAYAQLAAFIRTGNLQVESNSDKLDIVISGDDKSSRDLWDAHSIACYKVYRKFFYLYFFLHSGLICVAFWKLFL